MKEECYYNEKLKIGNRFENHAVSFEERVPKSFKCLGHAMPRIMDFEDTADGKPKNQKRGNTE